jgi:hypothetical protein
MLDNEVDAVSEELIIPNDLVNQIKGLIFKAREYIEKQVNITMLMTYWNVGQAIVDHEQGGYQKAEYGKRLLKNLSRELTRQLGKGFSVSNLQFMRRLYLEYPKQQTLSVKLSWSHYCELLGVSDKDARSFYERESINANYVVFYNKMLKAYVLIDLKIGSLKPEHIGQMNMYVNYYANEVSDVGDEKPIGIILCADHSEVVAEFALGGLENQIFASKYVYYIPDKQQLIKQVEDVIRRLGEESEEKE